MGGDDDDDHATDAVTRQEVTPSPWSRGMIVGLSAGLTLVIILIVGMLLLLRYVMRQRKLKMEFEDDLEMYRNR